MTSNDQKFTDSKPLFLPLLPLRDLCLFPKAELSLFVGRSKSVQALQFALQAKQKDAPALVVLSAQLDGEIQDPTSKDLHKTACIGEIKSLVSIQNNMLKVSIFGLRRVLIAKVEKVETQIGTQNFEYMQALCEEFKSMQELDEEQRQQFEKTLFQELQKYSKIFSRFRLELLLPQLKVLSLKEQLDFSIAQIPFSFRRKQKLLEEANLSKRLSLFGEMLTLEIKQYQLQIRLQKKLHEELKNKGKGQNTKQKEQQRELDILEKKLAQKALSKEAKIRVAEEIKRLRAMSPISSESAVLRSYLDWILKLPWLKYAVQKRSLKEAENILNREHFGLEKVKDRILEMLTVERLVEKSHAPILCLVGPPGVGKTSLAKSVAKASGREFIRISLGGVRDEAEIRGHRRTYIGALPGKIISAFKRSGTSNPLILLDEIDKMTQDFRGDPSSALLEVLDREQNHAFVDHYLDLDYDLSKVLFFCTANSIKSMNDALRDRLEVIQLSGYTNLEKKVIAEQFLIPKQLMRNGLTWLKAEQILGAQIGFSSQSLDFLIQHYVREAGVRRLEEEISKCCRKIAFNLFVEAETAWNDLEDKSRYCTDIDDLKDRAEDATKKVAKLEIEVDIENQIPKTFLREFFVKQRIEIDSQKVESYLGIPKFIKSESSTIDQIGVTKGLAWTQNGGKILKVEVALLPGKGKLLLTGQLGDVMQESAKAAMTYVRKISESIGLDPDFYEKVDVHIHVPAGATPKDGPSAGVTMVTSLVSAFSRRAVSHKVAMTGEINLQGQVLPIGGLKEKALAAYQEGCTILIFPKENEKDVPELHDLVINEMQIHAVGHLDQLLGLALVN